MKVLHAPVNVGNQPWSLSQQERRLGIQSELVTNYSTWIQYPADRCLSECGRKSFNSIVKRLLFGLSAPFRYDVIHYYFGRSLLCWDDFGPPNFLWFKDLKLARILGKKIFFTLQGCDVRLAGRSERNNQITMCRSEACNHYPLCEGTLDHRRLRLISKILPLCHRTFFLNPDLGHFISNGTFLPYANVDVEYFKPISPETNGIIRILHAPTDPSIKGTHIIVDTLEKLKKRFPIEFIQIQNLKHEDAIKLYRKADIAIDQLLAGWYGGFAVEMMAMGKPVVSYIRESDLAFIPPDMKKELPIINASPENLENRLIELIGKRHLWPKWSGEARQFVLRWHNPRKIAKAMIKVYREPDSNFELQKVIDEA